ncbi:MAG TPA: 6-phosphofructokinase [Gemmataceae bacterium]|jgi:6-phosphofructokinase 1|nr:6-phosphofructokinase [Gemmataceae bacterium]
MIDLHGKRLGMLVGGGPAPGINGVISAVTIEARNRGMEVIGFRDGFQFLVEENIDWRQELAKGMQRSVASEATKVAYLRIRDVTSFALKGGSILGTSRTNPAKKPEYMERVLAAFQALGIEHLVTIGGDDTAFSGSQVYAQAKGAIRVAHVPKTIDNDLPLPESTPTFGFETARHYGVGIVRALAEDAKTTSRWYMIVTMGRAAGHLALGIGKAAATCLTIIPEEFLDREVKEGDERVKLQEICDIIIGSIIKRKCEGKPYGLVILAEGLIESIGETGLIRALGHKLDRYATVVRDENGNIVRDEHGNPRLPRDDHGHLRLGEIEFGRIMRDQLAARMKQLGLKRLAPTFMDKDLGYELRCSDPIPYDSEYTRNLGYAAIKFFRMNESTQFGAIISFVGGKMELMPFEKYIDPVTKRLPTRIVNMDSESYEVAREYMMRLEHEDFQDDAELNRLADATYLPATDKEPEFRFTPEQFRQEFGYLAPKPFKTSLSSAL